MDVLQNTRLKNETHPGLFLCLQQMAFCTRVLSFDTLIGCLRVETVGQKPYREIIESCGFKDGIEVGNNDSISPLHTCAK